ncbi:hypothetical protein E4U45_002528 [Claviceps purpurea]|nr:hypothetical protein E4U45_002528 [Claviceps purpurea]
MIAGTPYFKAVSMRITRYALAKTVPQLDYARAELDKQRRDAGYQFTRCKGRHTSSLGLVAVTAGGMIGNMKIRSGGTADRAMREGSVDGAVTALLLLSRRSNVAVKTLKCCCQDAQMLLSRRSNVAVKTLKQAWLTTTATRAKSL